MILTPPDTPEWSKHRESLWNAVEGVEKRKDAQLAREFVLSLPHELSDTQRRTLVVEFAEAALVAKGMVVDIAIHRPDPRGDQRNHHSHILATMRKITSGGFGLKVRAWNEGVQLKQWRQTWERLANQALERAQVRERVDHRSLEARGIDREPEPKQGPIATKMERSGHRSKAGDDRRAVKARNAERAMIRDRVEKIEAELAARTTERRHEVGPLELQPSGRSTLGIATADNGSWKQWREQMLSSAYARDMQGSDLARYWRVSSVREGIIFENAKGKFMDRGWLLVTHDGNSLEIRGMLQLAAAKGWTEIVVIGTEDFRDRATRAAIKEGFKIQADSRAVELVAESLPPSGTHARTRSRTRESALQVGYEEDRGWGR